MHYEIHYPKSRGREVNDAAAMADIHEYCGPELWERIEKLFIAPRFDLASFAARRQLARSVYFACGMIGLQGYPAAALVRHVFAAQREVH